MVLGGSPMVYDRNKTAWFGVLLKRATTASQLPEERGVEGERESGLRVRVR